VAWPTAELRYDARFMTTIVLAPRRPLVLCAILAIGAFVLAPSNAAAQEGAYAGALGGVTFHTVSSGLFAGNAGLRVGRGLFVVGEVGRAADVLPTEIADELDDAEALIEELIGLPASLRVSVPMTYAFGGLRWLAPGERRIRPFLEAGLGVAHLSADIRASIGGVPVPDDLIDDFEPVDLDTNELLVALGGGVSIGLTRALAVDAGYRYFHVSVEEDAPAINTSVVYAGVRIGFGR
jgi:hypothetical protein